MFRFLQSKVSPTPLRASSKGLQSWDASSTSWDEQRSENKKWRKVENEIKDLVIIERSEGIIEVRTVDAQRCGTKTKNQ